MNLSQLVRPLVAAIVASFICGTPASAFTSEAVKDVQALSSSAR
jgi:hypothetical protein